jgi:hypothetical protein
MWRMNADVHGQTTVSTLDQAAARSPREHPAAPPTTLVWVDSREAILVRWIDDRPAVERIESEVPAHHRSTGHVRYGPFDRHGGTGPRTSTAESHRLEHLARFVDEIAGRIPREDDLVLLGPGTVRDHLALRIRQLDTRHRVRRNIRCEAARRLTIRQLVARLRIAMGDEPRRRTVGAYRWSERSPRGVSPHTLRGRRRVAPKPPRPDDEPWEA